jgi:hypothetical protein
MAKEKNKPVPVRFNLKLLEVLKEEEKIDTPQQALNFLANFWENNRPAKDGFEAGLKDVGAPAVAGASAAVGENAAKPKAAGKKEATGKKEGPAGAPAAGAPPAGLSGIDLSIWKAEQKEKNKGA